MVLFFIAYIPYNGKIIAQYLTLNQIMLKD